MIRGIVILLGAVLLFWAGNIGAQLYDQYRIWHPRVSLPEANEAPDVGPVQSKEVSSSGILFEDVAARVGLDFEFYDGAEGFFYIVETTGGGMAVFDYDNDGNQDVFLVNGSSLPIRPEDWSHQSQLFRSLGDRGFERITDSATVGMVAYGQGATVGDIDNDGFDELLLTTFHGPMLFHNQGDGTFREVSVRAGVMSDRWCTSAAFADLDTDGDVDLYVCAYGKVSLTQPLDCREGANRVHCFPREYSAEHDLLFENDGAGAFKECARERGVVDADGRGLGIAIADFTADGRPDIFVANDTSQNYLWVNQGQMRFTESALELGIALAGEGRTMAGMGAAVADYDHNGHLDVVVTDYFDEPNALFHNLGAGGFVDKAGPLGLAASSRDRLGWAALFLDADNDGWSDIFVANGHVSDFHSASTPYKMRQQLYWNRQQDFADISDSAGAYFHQLRLGRGAAQADFNNDGLPDVVCNHIRDAAALLLNQTARTNNWIGFELIGAVSNRNALNARIRITVAGSTRSHELVAGGGYLSASDQRVLFGLGKESIVEEGEIRWPSGVVQRLQKVDANRYHRIVEPLER